MYRTVVRAAARIELSAIRSEIRRREMELDELINRNAFQFRCGFYWQLAMQMMCCPQFDAEACELMGTLCGRLICFSRVLDTSDKASVELANSSIAEVITQFQKLNGQLQEEIAGKAFGLLDLLPVPDVMKRDMRAMWGKELEVLGTHLPNDISDKLSIEMAGGINKKISRAECTSAIIQSMSEHLKIGTERVDSDFVLRIFAITLAGFVSDCGKKRREFLNFMVDAWDEHVAARRKLDEAS